MLCENHQYRYVAARGCRFSYRRKASIEACWCTWTPILYAWWWQNTVERCDATYATQIIRTRRRGKRVKWFNLWRLSQVTCLPHLAHLAPVIFRELTSNSLGRHLSSLLTIPYHFIPFVWFLSEVLCSICVYVLQCSQLLPSISKSMLVCV